MNEPEMNAPEPSELGQQVAALQRQVFTLLVALIVVSGTLVAYLGYQSHHLGRAIDTIKPQAAPLIQSFKQNQTIMENFVNELAAYGQSHPEFRPVLQKYGINVTSAVSATSTSLKPAATTAAKPAVPKK